MKGRKGWTTAGRKRWIVEAMRAGLEIREILELAAIRWGSISAWKRWDLRFREAMHRAEDVGRPRRRRLRAWDRISTSIGARVEPAPEMSQLIHARARARVRGGGRGGVADQVAPISPFDLMRESYAKALARAALSSLRPVPSTTLHALAPQPQSDSATGARDLDKRGGF